VKENCTGSMKKCVKGMGNYWKNSYNNESLFMNRLFVYIDNGNDPKVGQRNRRDECDAEKV